MKILEKLWYDGLCPSETKLSSDLQHVKQMNILLEDEEMLLKMLPDDAKELYKKYTDSREELAAIDHAGIFIAGFRLGAKIMLEVMQEK